MPRQSDLRFTFEPVQGDAFEVVEFTLIDGPQIATVVGSPGEEIYCDEWDWVKVSFPWNRDNPQDDHSSCWSLVPTTQGDEAGAAKGIKSNTVGGQCYPLEKSSSVRAEGKLIVRHDDKFWMNGV